MNKILFFASAALATLFAGSCQSEEAFNAQEEVAVTLSVEVPQGVQTKAMSLAENTDVVYYEIWNSDWSKKLYPPASAAPTYVAVENGQATLSITLVSSQTYNFIFWAQNKDCGAYDVTDLKSVKVDYSVIAAYGNQDKYDAFYAVEKIAVTGPIDETITLYRPFAQLNFGADTMQTILGDVTVGATSVTVSRLATTFNTISGYGENEVADVTFTANGLATDTESLVVAGAPYTWVCMNYMLMMDDHDAVEVDAVFNLGMDEPVKHNVGNVPLKKNYRTNIVGDLFTTDAKLTIVIDPDFLQPDEDIVLN